MSFWIGLLLLALWVIIAFVVAWASGWAHVPLAVGMTLIARGIVLSNPTVD